MPIRSQGAGGVIDFGMTPSEFREQYFERATRLFRNALREMLFQWQDIDQLLQEHEPTPQELQLFNHGLIDAEDYTEDCSGFGVRRRRLNKVRFYGHLNAGATLVFNRFELHSSVARRLCAQVARFAGQSATSNAYVSFSGEGTFGKHWDTHDVFVLQLIGRKRWQVFAPTLPVPLSHQTSSRSGRTCPATPVLECVLEAGDVLYVPRGWWHHVTPLQEGSLHLSVGTYATTLSDYVLWASARALPEDVAARAALQPEALEALPAILERLKATLLDPRVVQEFLQQIAQREVTTAEFNLALFAGRPATPLSRTTSVQLNSARLRMVGDTVLVNGAALQLDALSIRILVWLSQAGVATLDDLSQKIGAPIEAMRLAIMNLNRYEIVSLQ